MKTTFFTITALSLAMGVLARNCTPNLNYCGSTLLSIGTQRSSHLLTRERPTDAISAGKYQGQIDQALSDRGQKETNFGKDAVSS